MPKFEAWLWDQLLLEQADVEAAERQSIAPSRKRRAPVATAIGSLRRRPWQSIVLNIALGLAATAFGLGAAGVFERGTPVGPEVRPSPTKNEGVAIAGTVKLLPLRVADPAGGLPWGLRALRTTRGLTCVQLGRVDFGTVGFLGRDGSFANDGRFHPLSQNYFNTPFGCAPTDARGHGFLNAFLQDLPASGGQTGPGCGAEEDRTYGPGARRRPTCPLRDLREVSFGLLGPDAVSVTHLTASGGRATTATTGTDGAYLVVLPHATSGCLVPDAHARFPTRCEVGFQGDTGGPGVPSGAVTAVTYRDGHVCRVPTPGSRASLFERCPPVGFEASSASRPTSAQLATPVSVRKLPARSYCAAIHGEGIGPCGARVPAGFRRLTGGWPSLLVEISFTSRVAITSSDSFYEFNLTTAHSHTCTTGGADGPTNADIRVGERVRTRMFIPYRCPGIVRGSVTYVPLVGPATAMPVPGLPGQGTAIPVGNFAFRVP
jgi:hypothetical protein